MQTIPFQLFKIFGVESRLKIIQFLQEKHEAGAKEIAEFLGITTAAVSQHLTILKDAGLVKSRRDGFYIPYSLEEENVSKCAKILSDALGIKGQTANTSSQEKINMDKLSLEELGELKKKLMKEMMAVQWKMSNIASRNKE